MRKVILHNEVYKGVCVSVDDEDTLIYLNTTILSNESKHLHYRKYTHVVVGHKNTFPGIKVDMYMLICFS